MEGEVRLPEISDLDKQDQNQEEQVQEQEIVEEVKQADPALALLKKQEIDHIVSQMNNLSDLFRDVSNLIIEQGTVLDRIDFHIAESRA